MRLALSSRASRRHYIQCMSWSARCLVLPILSPPRTAHTPNSTSPSARQHFSNSKPHVTLHGHEFLLVRWSQVHLSCLPSELRLCLPLRWDGRREYRLRRERRAHKMRLQKLVRLPAGRTAAICTSAESSAVEGWPHRWRRCGIISRSCWLVLWTQDIQVYNVPTPHLIVQRMPLSVFFDVSHTHSSAGADELVDSKLPTPTYCLIP